MDRRETDTVRASPTQCSAAAAAAVAVLAVVIALLAFRLWRAGRPSKSRMVSTFNPFVDPQLVKYATASNNASNNAEQHDATEAALLAMEDQGDGF
jgi:hypothetical protein